MSEPIRYPHDDGFIDNDRDYIFTTETTDGQRHVMSSPFVGVLCSFCGRTKQFVTVTDESRYIAMVVCMCDEPPHQDEAIGL